MYIQFYCIKYWKEEKFQGLNSQISSWTFKICGFAGVFMTQCTILHPNTQTIHQRSNGKIIAKKLECFKYTIRFMYFQFCQATSLHTSREHLRYFDLALHHQQNSCEREGNWTETKNGTICHCHLKLKIYFFPESCILTTVDSLFSVKALILHLHCNITVTTEAFIPGHQTPDLVKMQCMETKLFFSLHLEPRNTGQCTSMYSPHNSGEWNNPDFTHTSG